MLSDRWDNYDWKGTKYRRQNGYGTLTYSAQAFYLMSVVVIVWLYVVYEGLRLRGWF